MKDYCCLFCGRDYKRDPSHTYGYSATKFCGDLCHVKFHNEMGRNIFDNDIALLKRSKKSYSDRSDLYNKVNKHNKIV